MRDDRLPLPLRLTVSPRTLKNEVIELKPRAAAQSEMVPRADILAPLLLLATLVLFWSVAAGKVYLRPRYLLPLTAAGIAVHRPCYDRFLRPGLSPDPPKPPRRDVA